MFKIFRSPNEQYKQASFEECFYIQTERELMPAERDILLRLISSPLSKTGFEQTFEDNKVVEIGPRLSMETPSSSNAVAICRSIGLPISRIEMSNRYLLCEGNRDRIIKVNLDLMTQEIYESPLVTFDSGLVPAPVETILILEQGEKALHQANKKYDIGMDNWDINYYTEMFKRLGHNPTNVELLQNGNSNSEHSRHWLFKGDLVIDGQLMPETLMEIIKTPWRVNTGNSLVAFSDNSAVIRGTIVSILIPKFPGHPSDFIIVKVLQHITETGETHNHPVLIAPFQGAETGIGGCLRDKFAAGRGAFMRAAFAGYCIGNLHIPGFHIFGEEEGWKYGHRHSSPLDILIKGSNGISQYGNEDGLPVIGGFCRAFGQIFNNARREFIKPTFYIACDGRIPDSNVSKHPPEVGMLMVRIGGLPYRVGVGGGSASSLVHGAQSEEADLKSVQRGDGETANRTNRVLTTCGKMLENNPIETINDQGAGGISNAITELMNPLGGKVNIRQIVLGDKTMSVLEIWVAEFQESYVLLIKPENLELFKSICERERVNCDVLGEITGNGNVVVYDSIDNTNPVNLPLADILGKLPRKKFVSDHLPVILKPLVIPEELTFEKALQMIFTLLSVCSKGFLVHKVDRSVTGLIAQQQCCGPAQIPVSDAAVTADGYFDLTGAATAFGEQPIKMLIDPAAGARMALVEMLTNIISAGITDISDIKCYVNCIWAAKLPGQGALLYDAYIAIRDFMLQAGIAAVGGKDSLSPATKIGEELVVSPGQLVIKGCAPVLDITKVVTPDLKGSGCIGFMSLGGNHQRLGGSALAQALGQTGDETPDVDKVEISYALNACKAVLELIDKKLITAYHDTTGDGGLITALVEMCMAGNRGAEIQYNCDNPLTAFFCEEGGMAFEFSPESQYDINCVTNKHGVSFKQIGVVDTKENGNLCILHGTTKLLDQPVTVLRQWWEKTSLRLELEQPTRETSNPETVEAEARSHLDGKFVEYKLSFTPKAPNFLRRLPVKAAVLREEGTNGDDEMIAAFYTAGLDPVDIAMNDLRSGEIRDLDDFRGLVFPGGFSYADVFGSAKGWAASILFNPQLQEMFNRFYERQNTFSLGVCNGCQLTSNIGWLLYPGIPESSQPRLIQNKSRKFESRWVGVKILESPSILLKGMAGSVLGIHSAHGEGRFWFPDSLIMEEVRKQELASMVYVNPDGAVTETYPYNPNGSPEGLAALCSPDGRHLSMMPHPERCFLKWQWHYMPDKLRKLEAAPWLRLFQNAYDWCKRN